MDAGPPGAGDALKTCGIPSGQTCFLLRMGCNHESIVKKVHLCDFMPMLKERGRRSSLTIKAFSKVDDLVKSRHTGENRCPVLF